ncbi:MAG: hypothetical protein JO129_02755 [Candidatus Dependentiae bacterium]|nr:hypothetical protein [Candidatus Dependentiae bacterium]
MENIPTSSILNKKIHNSSHNNEDDKLFTIPFCEQDVLALQEIFISCGVHTIKTKNVLDGRQIIQTILNSLNYYHNVGCITDTFLHQLPITVCDIISHIKLQKIQKNNLLIDLEEFFAEHPCFDFIWIEFTEDIKNQLSLDEIQKIFTMYHAEERMSVLIMTYDEI